MTTMKSAITKKMSKNIQPELISVLFLFIDMLAADLT